MYIHPFVAGVIAVLLAESVGLIVYGLILRHREENDGKKK